MSIVGRATMDCALRRAPLLLPALRRPLPGKIAIARAGLAAGRRLIDREGLLREGGWEVRDTDRDGASQLDERAAAGDLVGVGRKPLLSRLAAGRCSGVGGSGGGGGTARAAPPPRRPREPDGPRSRAEAAGRKEGGGGGCSAARRVCPKRERTTGWPSRAALCASQRRIPARAAPSLSLSCPRPAGEKRRRRRPRHLRSLASVLPYSARPYPAA